MMLNNAEERLKTVKERLGTLKDAEGTLKKAQERKGGGSVFDRIGTGRGRSRHKIVIFTEIVKYIYFSHKALMKNLVYKDFIF